MVPVTRRPYHARSPIGHCFDGMVLCLLSTLSGHDRFRPIADISRQVQATLFVPIVEGRSQGRLEGVEPSLVGVPCITAIIIDGPADLGRARRSD